MASKTSDLPLNELYEKKITKSVEVAIQSKEDFSQISPSYCERVCKLKCKRPEKVSLLKGKVDILIIQDHAMPRGRFDRTEDASELIQRRIIDFICEKAGFGGLTYRTVNLLKCFPDTVDTPKGKSPTIAILQKCKPYLMEEIRASEPKVIISLSTAVTKTLGYTKFSNTNNRGEIVGGNVVITLHPRVLTMIRQNASGKMWGSDYFGVILRDFKKAARIARGELKIIPLEEALELQRANIKVCASLEEVATMVEQINSLPENQLISFDTETTGLDPMDKDARILCAQFGWRDVTIDKIVSVVVPLWHRDNTAYDPDVAWKMLVPLLLSPHILKVTQNGKFDYLYVYHTTGVRMQGWELDVMLMNHALSSGEQGCYGLKSAIWDFAPELGIGGYENLLPKLTKTKDIEEDSEEKEEEEDGD